MNNITNNFKLNSGNLNFKGKIMDESKMDNDSIGRVKLMEYCSKNLADKTEMEVPENGKFSPKAIQFMITGTDNIARLEVSYNVDNPKDLRDVNIGVRHKNSDRMYNNFGIYTGTKKEIIEYLKNIDIESVLGDVMNLSSKVDEYYS